MKMCNMQKSGKIFVHIGLPKTATSTLQTDYFPRLQSDRLRYIGADGYRRDSFNNPLYYEFLRAVDIKEGIDELKDKLANIVSTGTSLMISEERMTSSHWGATWRDMLSRLSIILADLDYAIILTVREPAAAMFSYFVEMYPTLIGKSFEECAFNDEAFGIYRYSELIEELSTNFVGQKVHAFKFEDIVQGEVGLLTRLLLGEEAELKAPTLNIHNSRISTTKRVYRQEPVTADAYVTALLNRYGLSEYFPSAGKKLGRKILRQLRFKKGFTPPTSVEMREVREFLKPHVEALFDAYRIDYRVKGH